MSDRDALLALEEQGWRTLSGGSGEAFYRRYLTDDALMVFPGGAVLSRDAALRAIASAPPWDWFRLEEARVVPVGDDGAVLAYRATAQRAGQPEYAAWMSSVYVRHAGAWKLAFHQQTPI